MTDIADLCKRLRRPGRNTCGMETNNPVNPDGPEAANTLGRQAAEIERLREALERVAHPTYGIEFSAIVGIARAALQEKTSDID